jgi:hypothetical protein
MLEQDKYIVPENHEARFVKIETRMDEGFTRMSDAIIQLTHATAEISKNTTTEIKELRSSLNTSNRTDWAKLIGFASIFLVVFGMWNSNIQNRQDITNNAVAKDISILNEYANNTVEKINQLNLNGTPSNTAAIEKVESKINSLEQEVYYKTADRYTKTDATTRANRVDSRLDNLEVKMNEFMNRFIAIPQSYIPVVKD